MKGEDAHTGLEAAQRLHRGCPNLGLQATVNSCKSSVEAAAGFKDFYIPSEILKEDKMVTYGVCRLEAI
jgi:hypothetical protein